MAQLKLNVLSDELVDKIIEEGLALLVDPGIRVHNEEALTLLAEAGAQVDFEKQVASIPDTLVRTALESTPQEFDLFDMNGEPVVHYGGNDIHFDPGSTAISILDSKTQRQRVPQTADLVKFVKLVDVLPQIDAQSTAMICRDVPQEISDLYRLYLVLSYSRKPVITGAFRKDTFWIMRELLAAAVNGEERLAQKPVAVFDVCPSPPLLWSDLTCQNLIDCARCGIPAELVSMPLAGATAPVTLAAAVVQHTAESLSGLVISQLARPGAPIVWGGSPAAFDMREGTTPMGCTGTWLIDCAYVQVGKVLKLPTHAYLGMSDAKLVDAQCGMETMGGMVMAALAGVNMISGAGMMDFESCQSFEKLVLDAEMIGMVKHLSAGIQVRDEPIALDVMRQMGHRAEYLSLPHTVKWFKKEVYLPSEVIDRSSLDGWEKKGAKNAFERAGERVEQLLAAYKPSRISEVTRGELWRIVFQAAQQYGMESLPSLHEE